MTNACPMHRRKHDHDVRHSHLYIAQYSEMGQGLSYSGMMTLLGTGNNLFTESLGVNYVIYTPALLCHYH